MWQNMQKTLAVDGDLLIALQLEQSRLARHNVDLSKKVGRFDDFYQFIPR